MQEAEQQIAQNWDMEARKYSSCVAKLSNVQKAVLACARNYYETIKANLTDNGKVDIAYARYSGNYSGEYFPHSLKTNELAMAWIMKVGSNPDMLKRLFPNQAMRHLSELRPVHFEGKLYDYNRPGLKEFKQSGTSKDTLVDYRMVLVVLRYILLCEHQNYDRIECIETNKHGVLKRIGKIEIQTKYYFIYIPFKGLQGRAFNYIDVIPKKAILNR